MSELHPDDITTLCDLGSGQVALEFVHLLKSQGINAATSVPEDMIGAAMSPVFLGLGASGGSESYGANSEGLVLVQVRDIKRARPVLDDFTQELRFRNGQTE